MITIKRIPLGRSKHKQIISEYLHTLELNGYKTHMDLPSLLERKSQETARQKTTPNCASPRGSHNSCAPTCSRDFPLLDQQSQFKSTGKLLFLYCTSTGAAQTDRRCILPAKKCRTKRKRSTPRAKVSCSVL